jgi:hypothetical protein
VSVPPLPITTHATGVETPSGRYKVAAHRIPPELNAISEFPVGLDAIQGARSVRSPALGVSERERAIGVPAARRVSEAQTGTHL